MNDEEDRKARLAQALRHNLRRRKAQARGEGVSQPLPSPPSSPAPDPYDGDEPGASSDMIPKTR